MQVWVKWELDVVRAGDVTRQWAGGAEARRQTNMACLGYFTFFYGPIKIHIYMLVEEILLEAYCAEILENSNQDTVR